MNEKIARTFFISAASFAVGCVATSAAGYWANKHLEKTQPKKSNSSDLIDWDTAESTLESARAVMEQTVMPTLLAAKQAEWSSEVFENNITAQFGMLTTILISLYQEGLKENMTLEDFKKTIRSEINFILISAKEPEI